MSKDRNYTGTTRFIDDADVLTAEFGFTGDIAFVIKPGETTTTEKYVKTTSGTTGALEVVADDYPAEDTTTYTEATSGTTGALEVVADDYPAEDTTTYETATASTEGALKVVADDAADFDPTTQVKIGDVTGITVEVGDYVTKTVTPGFNENTQVKIGDVEADVTDVVVGDYVKKESTSTTGPSTCTGSFVKLDREWIAFPAAE